MSRLLIGAAFVCWCAFIVYCVLYFAEKMS
jgi:hypothetical protein